MSKDKNKNWWKQEEDGTIYCNICGNKAKKDFTEDGTSYPCCYTCNVVGWLPQRIEDTF